LLTVQILSVAEKDRKDGGTLLRGVSFSMAGGEIVGLVGESGSGKSLTGLALMGLLPPGLTAAGRVMFDGRLLDPSRPEQWEQVRGRRIAMVFQEPASCLNPVLQAGRQVSEVFTAHGMASGAEARRRALAVLGECGVESPQARFSQYPHQLSGGLKQRVMLAMAVACGPDLLIADEPTSALDPTVQRQVLSVLEGRVRETGTALLLISHDLGVIARLAQRVLVMHKGRIVESGATGEVCRRPRHPYTRRLLSSRLFPDGLCHDR
jgi:ABC-type glutathione transport system ATPase component